MDVSIDFWKTKLTKIFSIPGVCPQHNNNYIIIIIMTSYNINQIELGVYHEVLLEEFKFVPVFFCLLPLKHYFFSRFNYNSHHQYGINSLYQ